MRSEKRIYALGFFDGVHLGHQALLSACRDLAEKESCTPAAITFAAHPKSLFSASVPALLTALRVRCTLHSGCCSAASRRIIISVKRFLI